MPVDLRSRYLRAMGVEVWVRRGVSTPATAVAGTAAQAPEAPAPPQAEPAWVALQQEVAGCRACALHKGRTQTVFGVGSHQAEWMFIGEAPGAEEDRRGEPFVGRAGQLLNAMLRAAGRAREDVFIANILKCRPPNNRDPRHDEAGCCAPFLVRQIEMLQPRLIIALGRVAAQRLLETDVALGRLRGRTHYYQAGERTVPLVVTYHPAYLLRSPRDKRKAWEDLLYAMDVTSGVRS